MSAEQPSRQLVDQRIRNRIIEYLELAASFDEQVNYETRVPFVNVPYEIISQWKDWVPTPTQKLRRDSAVFSEVELETIDQFRRPWRAAFDAIGNNFPSVREVQALPEWGSLQGAARRALEVFAKRGPMPDDQEVRLE